MKTNAQAPILEATTDRRNRDRDVAALEQMCRPVSEGGQRPLKPPPYSFGPRVTRVAMLAVREDRKAGVLV
jgi:hypothetical protein